MEGGVEVLLKYYKKVQKRLGTKAAVIIFILRTGIHLYPILRAEGYGLHAPIAVVLEEEQMLEDMVEELRGFAEPVLLSLDAKKRDLEEALQKAEYELVTVFCRNKSERNIVNLSYLSQIMLSGKVNKMEFLGVIVVVFIGGVPPELLDFFAGQIVLERKEWEGEIEHDQNDIHNLYEKYQNYLPVVIDVLHQIRRRGMRDKDFLFAATDVTRFLLTKGATEEEEKISMFDIYADVMKNGWDYADDYEAWIERLRINLCEKMVEIDMAKNRKELICEDEISCKRTLFYDEDFYYITERAFSEACKNIACYVSQIEMKHALAEAGILHGEGGIRKYFTVKMPISTPSGVRILGRRLRIVRKWIDRPGELTWVDQIKIRKGDVRHD